MTGKQLDQITEFCKPYYHGTGRWHGWDHITGVRKLATAIAQKEFPKTNLRCIQAAATIHDMGRIVRDEGHAEESGRIAKPFLKIIQIPENEAAIILDAVVHHDVKKIDQAKSVEARIVFDADKIEILSVYGFSRVWYWLVEERHMELGEALRFLWDYCSGFKSKLHSDFAKEVIAEDFELLSDLVKRFDTYETAWRR
jgi:5'-deoxynucleotidase YfbR-like HD superfamily hydrolase